jgi:predicted nucleic acid-binding protein
MKRYLLDTAPLASLLLARPAAVDLIRPWLHCHEVATSILAYAEVVEYIKDFSDAPRRYPQLRTLLGEVYPYFLTYPILERYTNIRRSLRRPHGKGLIGDIDTLIAATALERNLTVVTIDMDFQRVPHLKVLLLFPSTMKVLSIT